MQKPVFEIMEWSVEELAWQAAFFSIDDNKDKPTLKPVKNHVTVDESIADLRRVLHS